jgi:hypothetical protein
MSAKSAPNAIAHFRSSSIASVIVDFDSLVQSIGCEPDASDVERHLKEGCRSPVHRNVREVGKCLVGAASG